MTAKHPCTNYKLEKKFISEISFFYLIGCMRTICVQCHIGNQFVSGYILQYNTNKFFTNVAVGRPVGYQTLPLIGTDKERMGPGKDVGIFW